MSEFKFACPVCGQHITADSRSSGQHLECPTCFRKIVVPQAPARPDSKLILSAKQVGKQRPGAAAGDTVLLPPKRSAAARLLPVGLAVIALAGGSALAWIHWSKPPVDYSENPDAMPRPAVKPRTPELFPIPADLVWSLDVTNLVVPESPAAGRLWGRGFKVEKVSLQGNLLSLQQGKRWAPEFTLHLALPGRPGEELSGKSIQFAPGQKHGPRISMTWKDEAPKREDFHKGYALKVSFGQATNGHLPGRIYLCLPDSTRSVVAGTFDAVLAGALPGKAPELPTAQLGEGH